MPTRFTLLAATLTAAVVAHSAPAAPPKNPLTPEMRTALDTINKVHGGMNRKTIDDAVAEFHRVIDRSDPKVFVPHAVPHLMRLAPADTQTRLLLRKALANGWMDRYLMRAFLIQAGDDPGPHIQAMLKALDGKDVEARRSALRALTAVGAEGAEALPKLRSMIEKAKANPDDFRRAYSATDIVPEHVLAHWAIEQIEAAGKEAKKR